MFARLALWLFPAVAAAVLSALLGTDKLGRDLTAEERRDVAALLRAHDFPNARLRALASAYRHTRDRVWAEDLVTRAEQSLLRQGWDPADVPLVDRLCRLVWSEWTHQIEANEAAERAATGLLQEMSAEARTTTPSTEHLAVESEDAGAAEARTKVKIAKLRALFTRKGDTVNLLYMDLFLEGLTEPHEMAERTGRKVSEFHAAKKRRARAAARMTAEEAGVARADDGDDD